MYEGKKLFSVFFLSNMIWFGNIANLPYHYMSGDVIKSYSYVTLGAYSLKDTVCFLL